jgi:hypothetical protein
MSRYQNEIMPPRRGQCLAIEVDSTARAYDLSTIAFGGVTPNEAAKEPQEVVLYLQAQTNDVFFYFADGEVGVTATTDVDDIDNTAKITAGSAIAFANTYAAQLDATTKAPMKIRINRAQDRFLVVKAASTAGVLRIWVGSASF